MMHPRLKDLVAGLDLQTDLWWVATMFVGLMIGVLAAVAFGPFGSFWAWVLVAVRFSMLICLAQQPWGAVFSRLLAFGVAVGAFSILPDHLTATWTHGAPRVYPPGEAAALSSPLYVPLLWACTLAELGYASIRLHGLLERHVYGELALGLAMAAGSFIAAVVTASTEFLAVRAGWWSYPTSGVLLGDACPLHVVLGHFFAFFFFLPVFQRYLASPGTPVYAAVRYGAVFAGILFLSYALSHALVERGRG
jgi:hypothetical protein